MWVPVGFVAFLFSAPVNGTMAAKERLDNGSKQKKVKERQVQVHGGSL